MADEITIGDCEVIIKTVEKNGAKIQFEYGNIKNCKLTMDLYDTLDVNGQFFRQMEKAHPTVNISFEFSAGQVVVKEPKRFEKLCRKLGLIE